MENGIPAKLLLFGEYAVLNGGDGLVMPIRHYSGRLCLPDTMTSTGINSLENPSKDSNEAIASYASKLKAHNNRAVDFLDFPQFKQDLNAGLWFDSTIPQGYGLGSSGALIAALFKKYGVKDSQEELSRLKAIFAQLEAPFHGLSSGLDPLVCYLNEALVFGKETGLTTTQLPANKAHSEGEKGSAAQRESQDESLREGSADRIDIYLEDTGKARKTGPLVDLFKEKCTSENYARAIESELLPANKMAIRAFLKMDTQPTSLQTTRELWKHLTAISVFQWEKLREMIPSRFHEDWQTSLETDTDRWKLCGAGGGGFLLRFKRAQAGKIELSHPSKLIYSL